MPSDDQITACGVNLQILLIQKICNKCKDVLNFFFAQLLVGNVDSQAEKAAKLSLLS